MTIRITDGYMSRVLVTDLNRSLGELLRQQRMAGSLRRVTAYADDPRAVGAIQRYRTLIGNNEGYLRNVARGRTFIDATDAALQDVSAVLADVRVIALRESSGLATPASMGAAASELAGLVDRLVAVLNTSVEGNHIFAGAATDSPPFARVGGTVVYRGDDATIESRTGPHALLPVNLPGSIFTGSGSAVLGGRIDLAPRLTGTTLLADLSGGQGWSAGAFSVADGAGQSWQVDLTDALTVADVLAAIEAATGGAVGATISADGSALELTGTGPLAVGELGGTTAASLGLDTAGEEDRLTGRDIRAAAGPTTPLHEIAALSGGLPLGAVAVSWRGATTRVDFSGATTLGDLQQAITAAVPGLELQLGPDGLRVVADGPEPFTITNTGTTRTGTRLGITGEGNPLRLFGVLEDLQAALAAGDGGRIRGTLDGLATLTDLVHQLLVTNGGRQSNLDWTEEILLQRDERLRASLSRERDADVAQVAADLSRAETSYEASLLVTSRLYQTNLMQFLR
jgi:flagellar hook-associated protein 3 FlgL